jgi:hypothetical protein
MGSKVYKVYNHAFTSCINLSSITCTSPTAPEAYNSPFGYDNSTYTGRNTYNKGVNKLYVLANSTGYEAMAWGATLCNSSRCGFTLEKIL